MAEFLKSQTPQELWKTALKPKDPLKPQSTSLLDPGSLTPPLAAAKTPGTGLVIDTTA